MKLTIVIPYYKLAFFRETLKSLTSQTDKRFYVFIGNDDSPEDPENLLKEFENKFLFIYKKFEENIGGTSLTKQWERCLGYINTEWFLILGDDDILASNAVEEFYKTIEKGINDFRVLRFQRQVINEENKAIAEITHHADNQLSTDFVYRRSKNTVVSSLSEYVFRISDYKRLGIKNYPSAFYSDNWMMLLYSNFGPLKNINSFVKVRISNYSISGNQLNKNKLNEAAFYFYSDLLKSYSNNFSLPQKSMFWNILLRNINIENINMTKMALICLSIKKLGWFRTVYKLFLIAKY